MTLARMPEEFDLTTGGNPIVDMTISVDNHADLAEATHVNGWKGGDKVTASPKHLPLFDAHRHDARISPGGSTANVAAGLARLFKTKGRTFNTAYFGMYGDDPAGRILQRESRADNVYLFPGEAVEGKRTARSLVINGVLDRKNNKNRVIVTDPGDAAHIGDEELPSFRNRIDAVTQKTRKNGAVLVAGGMMEKMPDKKIQDGFVDNDSLGIGDSLVTASFNHDKELWFALPTTEQFAKLSADRMRYIIGRSNVILGNDEELQNIFGGDSREETLDRLQKHLQEFGLANKQNWNKKYSPSNHIYNGPTDQAALITCDGEGADIVTATDIFHIHACKLRDGERYMLGAGDAAFTGFLFGWMHRYELGYGLYEEAALRQCGDMAMALAAETIMVPQARHDNPAGILRPLAPELFEVDSGTHENGHATAHSAWPDGLHDREFATR